MFKIIKGLLINLIIINPLFANSWLHQNLSQDSFFYLRIPHPTYLINTIHPDIFQNISSDANTQYEFKQLLSKFYKFIDAEGYEEDKVLFNQFIKYITGAIEISLSAQDDPINPTIVVTMPMVFDTYKQVNNFFSRLDDSLPFITLKQPINYQKKALLDIFNFSVVIDYDLYNKQLTAVAGQDITVVHFNQFKNKSITNTNTVYFFEQALDTTQQGLFIWLDIKTAKKLYQNYIPNHIQTILKTLGIWDAKTFAFGWGSVEDKGRLGAYLAFNNNAFLKVIPDINPHYNLKTAGNPKAVIAVSLPIYEMVKALVSLADVLEYKEVKNFYNNINLFFYQQFEISLDEVLYLLGPDIIYYQDQVGLHLALEVKDAEKLYKLINQLTKLFDIDYKAFTIADQIYHQIKIPFFKGLQQRIYWIEEEDYLIFSFVPQSLMAHHQMDKGHLQDWLIQEQKLSLAHTLLLFSAKFHDIPDKIYYSLLYVLPLLADIIHYDVNVFAFPSPLQANLPKSGSYSIEVNKTSQLLSFRLTFESHPAEILFSNSIGIALATAVITSMNFYALEKIAYDIYLDMDEFLLSLDPSYLQQGYLEDSLGLITTIEDSVYRYWQTHQVLPQSNIDAGLPPAENINAIGIASIEITEQGSLWIIFNEKIDKKTLELQPSINVDQSIITWHCGQGSLEELLRAVICSAE